MTRKRERDGTLALIVVLCVTVLPWLFGVYGLLELIGIFEMIGRENLLPILNVAIIFVGGVAVGAQIVRAGETDG